ncbi:MAG: hypothetical protein ACLUUN_01115 [Muribaculaceae bacterium]
MITRQILPDHTPLDLMTHTNDPVPFMIYKKSTPAAGGTYSEEGAKESGIFIENGPKIMEYFINL